MKNKTYGSIRVDNGMRYIEVNDNGDTIGISIEDAAFYEKYNAFLKWLQSQNEEHQKATEEESILEFMAKFGRELSDKLDSLFGAGASKKVFGDATPSVYMAHDFFEQITPIMEKIGKERTKELQKKYSPDRKGNV
jgi:hypothetical protein